MNKIGLFFQGFWFSIKRFIKELKRVKWATPKETGRAYSGTIIFVVVSALILFALALVLSIVWQKIGVGI